MKHMLNKTVKSVSVQDDNRNNFNRISIDQEGILKGKTDADEKSILKNQRGWSTMNTIMSLAILGICAYGLMGSCVSPKARSYNSAIILGQNNTYNVGRVPIDADKTKPMFASTESDGDICLSYTSKSGNFVVQHYALSPILRNKYIECGKFVFSEGNAENK